MSHHEMTLETIIDYKSHPHAHSKRLNRTRRDDRIIDIVYHNKLLNSP